jgi:hypothetical protein
VQPIPDVVPNTITNVSPSDKLGANTIQTPTDSGYIADLHMSIPDTVLPTSPPLTPEQIRNAIIRQAKWILERWKDTLDPFQSAEVDLPVVNNFRVILRQNGDTSAATIEIHRDEPRTAICRVFRQYGTYAAGWANNAAAADEAVAGRLSEVLAALAQ